MPKKLQDFLLAQLLVFAAAGIGSSLTYPKITTWYTTLEKPFFTPPNWIFGPVWTTLYFLMGISLYLLWQQKGKKNKTPHKKVEQLFYIQLLLNVMWSLVFFGLENPLLGVVDILALWTVLLLIITTSWKKLRIISYLFIPYVLWVSFASLLNVAIVFLQ